MGIPYYFKYLTQKYPQMISYQMPSRVDYLFMDCNSVVYDSVNAMRIQHQEINDETVIDQVLFRLWEYIQTVSPRHVLYLAFDGVAPLGKMKQQKSRRLRTAAAATPESTWATTCITPGTLFMQKLSQSVHKAFKYKEREIGVQEILLSTSEEVGEGEHKLFAWLRQCPRQSDIHLLVYGMDADLIMLSLLHIHCTGLDGKVWVFRETPPERGEQKPSGKEKEKGMTFIDIVQLGAAIRQEMDLGAASAAAIREYIFLCFFLGNDFLPHFPSMNIRTHGIPTLLEVYRSVGLGNHQHLLIDPTSGKIQWPEVHRFIDRCAKYEHEWLLQEYQVRDKMQHHLMLYPNQKEDMLENAPILLRGVENYIHPQTLGWHQRYYDALFPSQTQPRKVCDNYLEGLQWVYSYYSEGCTDWQWQYHWDYPPLWSDLSKHFHIPPTLTSRKPHTSAEQLSYVMPQTGVDIELKYQWAFCRYLWEAHVMGKT